MSDTSGTISIVEEKWNEILEHVRDEHELSDASFTTWLVPLSVHRVEEDVVTISVPTERFGLDYITRRFALPIKVAISEVTGRDYEVRFVIPAEAEAEQREVLSRQQSQRAGLTPRYTFDSFVVGNNNKMAHAASLAVAENPGDSYNPLFLYGGSGLGKTHLMNAIAHFVLETRPEMRVLYVTSEDFTNEVIEAIRNGSQSALTSLRDKYRHIDVFLVDDIQFIIGRESTQEEFFHTFNALHSAGKQIVLTSDRPPKDMELLDERFRSRFVQGLMVDIRAPDYENRVAILKKKNEQDGTRVDNEVLDYIATNITSNIRDLEGALNKVVHFSRLEKRRIDTALAESALADMISPTGVREITPAFIIDVVADHFNITPADIRSNSKARKVAYPRQVAMYLCRKMTDSTFQEVAELVGVTNHTTVLYGVEKIAEEYEASDTTKNTIDILIKKINPPTS